MHDFEEKKKTIEQSSHVNEIMKIHPFGRLE